MADTAQDPSQHVEPEPRHSLARFLALNRTVAVVLLAVLLFGLGEELWGPFMPAYLRAQGKQAAHVAEATPAGGDAAGAVGWAALWAVGVYGFLRNLFEGFCYIGGGQLTARLGDRGSLMLFGVLTLAGYALFLAGSVFAEGAAWVSVVAALLIVGWEPLSVPVTFTTVGSTVAASRRGMAFAVQSIQKRLPKILGPALAGVAIGALGPFAGMRLLVAAAMGLAVVSLAMQFRYMPHRQPPPPGPSNWAILRDLHPTLRRLLLADAGRHTGVGRALIDPCLGKPGLGFGQGGLLLAHGRLNLGRVDARQHLSCLHTVAFPYFQITDTPGHFGRNLDVQFGLDIPDALERLNHILDAGWRNRDQWGHGEPRGHHLCLVRSGAGFHAQAPPDQREQNENGNADYNQPPVRCGARRFRHRNS